MYGIAPPIELMVFAIGGVGGMWLDVLISLHNRAMLHVSHRVRMPSLLHAMGTAGLACFVFFVILTWSEPAVRHLSNALSHGGRETAIGHAIEATIALVLCATCHIVVFWPLLQLRFRHTVGLSLIYLAGMVPVGICLNSAIVGQGMF